MRFPYTQRAYLLSVAAITLALAACSDSSAARAPIVAGLGDKALDARSRGIVLLGELGCVNCHAPSNGNIVAIDAQRGPNLVDIGNRVNTDYILRFVADPQSVDPGTTMPALLFDRSESARNEAAAALTDYLRSFASAAPAAETLDNVAAARGKTLFHQVGCVACHAPRDEKGHELSLPDSLPLGDLSAKYRPSALRAFLLAPDNVRPDSRMPDLHLTPIEAHELTSYLLASASPSAPVSTIAPKQVALGRSLFAERGCAACHALADAARPATRNARGLNELANSSKGCLSKDLSSWPMYELTDVQRSDIAAALSSLDAPVTDEQRIHQRLASRNCLACHQRGESGGIPPDRSPYFTTNDESTGQDSRIPPPLTGIGAKLQDNWLIDSIAHGQAIRPYLNTRMPGFGVSIANTLGELFARTDKLPELELPQVTDDDKALEETRKLGCDLVGDKGMNCIACHYFAGERVGAMAAVDLIDSTGQRLRREWFHHYLRAPFEMRPGTLMPQFFVNGNSMRPEFGGGDVMAQIDAMWQYLAEGRNARQPSGMRHLPIELEVGSETVMLRRNAQHTGKRGISVGYPGGVNLTFDAESLGLNQIWWGKFIEASGVWTGQGSGETHPLSQQVAQLPKGPAFVALTSVDAPWPSATRRELGGQWLGYDLDQEQRPTFRYVFEGVTISDTPIAVAADSPAGLTPLPILRRTLTFTAAKDTTLSFRAALDARIEDQGNGELAVGKSLRLRLPPGSFRIRPFEKERELIATIQIQQGRAELVIDYRWQEEGK